MASRSWQPAYMLALFRPPVFEHPVLGPLRRKGGSWHGTIKLEGHSVPLNLPGDRTRPDPAALSLVDGLPRKLPAWRDSIAAALFDHLEPYAQADEEREFSSIKTPADIWPHARPAHVRIFDQAGSLVVELGYTVVWDEDHTLGARFINDSLVELNGSTGPL